MVCLKMDEFCMVGMQGFRAVNYVCRWAVHFPEILCEVFQVPWPVWPNCLMKCSKYYFVIQFSVLNQGISFKPWPWVFAISVCYCRSFIFSIFFFYLILHSLNIFVCTRIWLLFMSDFDICASFIISEI